MKNGSLDFSSNGIGIGLSAEAFAGMGTEGMGDIIKLFNRSKLLDDRF